MYNFLLMRSDCEGEHGYRNLFSHTPPLLFLDITYVLKKSIAIVMSNLTFQLNIKKLPCNRISGDGQRKYETDI